MHQRFGASNGPRRRRAPTKEEFSDSEVLTVLLVGELCQVKRERAWLQQVRASYGALFLHLPEDSRFSRRAQVLRELLRPLRASVLCWAGEGVQPVRVLDSFPMPLCACYRIRQSSQAISGSSFAYNNSKCEYYFGLHSGFLLTEHAYIDYVFLAPGYFSDVALLTTYLDECIEISRDVSGQEWIGDKGFASRALKQAAKKLLDLTLLMRQRDYKGRFVAYFEHLLDTLRKPIEGVISVLTENFGLEDLLVRSDIGLYRRTQAKSTPFSLFQRRAWRSANGHRLLRRLKTGKTRIFKKFYGRFAFMVHTLVKVSEQLVISDGNEPAEKRRQLEEVAVILDDIHSCRGVPKVIVNFVAASYETLKGPKQADTWGSYSESIERGNQPEIDIYLTISAGGHSLELPYVGFVFLHEMGHYLDNLSFQTTQGFASDSLIHTFDKFILWNRAVRRSSLYRHMRLLRDRCTTDSSQYRAMNNYFMSSRELFACAYSQHITELSANDDLVHGLNYFRTPMVHVPGMDRFARQWEPNDFVDVKHAIEAILNRLPPINL